MPSFRGVLSGGRVRRRATASSSTARTTSSLRSLMSRVTPEEEYAAGIVSCASQAPFAYWKKSVQALTVASIQCGSMTRSGLRSESEGAAAEGGAPWAAGRAGKSASSTRKPRRRRARGWRVRAANGRASIGGGSE